MALEWSQRTLADICILSNGKAIPKDCYVEAGHVTVWGSNGPIGQARSSRFEGEVAVIGRVGAYCGSVHRATGPSWVTDNAIVVVARPGVSQRFVYYLLRYLPLHRQRAGSAQPLITQKSLKRLRCPMASLDDQHRIAAVLGALDDKIELNRRMNRTLEEMAQALFKSWFVDFDGHDPANLVGSELGPIPCGWGIGPVGSAVKVVGGATPRTKNPAYWEGGTHCWTTPKDLSAQSCPLLLSTARHITDAGLATISSGLLPKGTFLMSSRAPVGYTAIARVPLAVNQGYIAIPPGGRLSPLYLLHWARAHLDLIKSRAGGTTFAEISKKNFRPIPVVLPPEDRLRAFELAVTPLFDGIENNERESITLADLRDTLLPKLISGEIRIPEAEAAVEAAL